MRSLSLTLLGIGSSLALVSLLASGCGSPVESASSKNPGAGAEPETRNLKEEIEEKWMADAIKGLTFNAGGVAPTVRTKSDRGLAVVKTEAANQSYEKENIWFKAAGMFRDAILLDPSYAPAYEGLARTLMVEGGPTYAEPALKTALKLDPSFDKARFELGTVEGMKGDNKSSIETWKELVKRSPDYPDAFARLSIASYFEHDYDSAYQYLAEADKRKQNVPSQFRPLLKEAAQRP